MAGKKPEPGSPAEGVPLHILDTLKKKSMVGGNLSLTKFSTNIANWKKAKTTGGGNRTPTRPKPYGPEGVNPANRPKARTSRRATSPVKRRRATPRATVRRGRATRGRRGR